MILADLGAEVLRVESPYRSDLVREMPQRVGPVSAAHATINRSKRFVSLDLNHPKAKDIVKKLFKNSISCWNSSGQE